MSPTQILVCLGLLVSYVSCQTSPPPARCFTCLYAERQGERPTGATDCLQPSIATVRTELCNGNCYKVDVMEEDKGVQYLQRGCLQSCRNHDEYPVSHYGVGAIHCCNGDLCNLSPALKINYFLLVSLILLPLLAALRL